MASALRVARLPHRGAVRVAGPKAGRILQGTLSQQLSWGTDSIGRYSIQRPPSQDDDTNNDSADSHDGGRLSASALMNARGRVLADVLVHEKQFPSDSRVGEEDGEEEEEENGEKALLGTDFVLECDRKSAPAIAAMLRSSRVHAQEFKVADISDRVAVWVQWMDRGESDCADYGAFDGVHDDNKSRFDSGIPVSLLGGVWRPDPRLRALGFRCIVPRGSPNDQLPVSGKGSAEATPDLGPGHELDMVGGSRLLPKEATSEAFDVFRTLAGVPEGPDEIVPEKALPLESNMEILNLVSLNKGCYVGQELTARTFHTGVTRKRLLPFCARSGNDKVSPGADILDSAGKSVGKVVSLRSGSGVGFALIRLGVIPEEASTPAGIELRVAADADARIALAEPLWWKQWREAT